MNYEQLFVNPTGRTARSEYVPALLTLLAAFTFYWFLVTGRTGQFALLVMLAIAARLIYGWWHATHRSAISDQHWLWSASGTQLSVAVAAGLIGYYLVYAIGVRVRITRHEKGRPN